MFTTHCFADLFLIFTCFLSQIYCKGPNFVLFLTDDQDLLLDGMMPMQFAVKAIANEGLTFTQAYVHSPLCCPSRSSLLTGKYLHNLRVFNNTVEGNCSSSQWQQTHETRTIAAHLKSKANYVNFYAGKYLNQYGSKEANHLQHVPAGYDWWYGLGGNSKYYNFSLSINGTKVDFEDKYLTDLMATFALDFLAKKPIDREFFMVLSTPAPHAPFIAAKRHLDRFPNVTKKLTPSFNATAWNKHWLLQLPPTCLPADKSAILDSIQRRRMQTLLSVDELVAAVVQQLDEMNVLNETYVMFTSDNGFHIGQFGLPWDKRQPYETDIHVPFIMRGPNMPKKQMFVHPISLVDLAPTIWTLANVTVPEDVDGKSFAHLLQQEVVVNETFRDHLLVEYFGEGNTHSVQAQCNFTKDESHNLSQCSLENWCKCQDSRNNTYSCIVDFGSVRTIKYCSFRDDVDFIEVYNLTNDPYELVNIASTLTSKAHAHYGELLATYKQCAGKTCNHIHLHL